MLLTKKKKHLSPPIVISGSFIALILLGTLLLKLPFASVVPITWTDAFFTATSATTVTGLVVFDPGNTLTLFGELILLVLIQSGGIGLMTFAVAVFMLLGKKVGLQNRVYLQEAFNQNSLGGIVKMARLILFFVLSIEALASLLLTVYWFPAYGWAHAFYLSVFHVISAFNNAGFSLFEDGLIRFAGDPIVNLLLSSLFILGGIGFTVVIDIYQKKSFFHWSLHTKIMVVGTLILNVGATLLFFLLEYNNPNTIGEFSLYKKTIVSYFSAVTPRTAGFNTLDYGMLEDPTLLFTMLLMFIGAGSASTASGIKLSTFIVVILATIAFFRAREEPEIFGRSLRIRTVIRSLAITTLGILTIMTFLFFLTITESIPFLPLAFEIVSAFGTVGLSMGITADLSDAGKVLLSVLMFLGRVGPLTLFFLLLKPKKVKYRYPYDQIFTG